ncbi:hypothetical protein TNCV_2645521 [Trichonephila clavipes]|nr:hypothetical protein TNCV_2645521 [Trichonephila clavipes]
MTEFDLKVPRNVSGGIQENGIWRRRHNTELYRMLKEPDVGSRSRLELSRPIGGRTLQFEKRCSNTLKEIFSVRSMRSANFRERRVKLYMKQEN